MNEFNSSIQQRRVGFSDYWWFIITLFPFFHWLPFIIVGAKTKKMKWIIWGGIYLLILVATVMFSNVSEDKTSPMYNVYGLLAVMFFVSWVASIFHIFSIRKEYLFYLSQIPEKFIETSAFDARTGQHINQFQLNLGKHGKILTAIERLRFQISEELKNAGKNNSITQELMPIVNKYVEQTKELASRDARIESLLQNSNTKEIDFKIRELRRKIDRTGNAELMQQYMESISSLEQNKKLYGNFEDQREVIRLKLEAAHMDLQKMKMNLINMENLSSQDQNTVYLKDFETKSQELTTYLELLKEYK